MVNFIRRRFKLFLILTVIAAIFFFVYRRNFVSPPKYNIKSTTTVKKGSLEEKMVISGEIDAEEKVTLRFQTSGRLAWVGVKEGDYVKKYQGIASLNQKELQMKLKKELNDYLNERWDFDQVTKDDYRDKVFTDTVKRIMEKAQFDLNNAVLDVEIQHLAVEYANLWTPIEGIVIKALAPFAGVNITPAQAEFEIVNPNSIYFSATADETEVTKLFTGLNGELLLDAYPDTDYKGKIGSISFIPKSGESGTVYKVKFNFPNENRDYNFRLGMVGDLTFVTKKQTNILYLSNKFIISEKGKNFVYLKTTGKPKEQTVKIGMETDAYSEITSGLKKGDVVYLPQ